MNTEMLFQAITSMASTVKTSNTQATNNQALWGSDSSKDSSNSNSQQDSFKSQMDKVFDKKNSAVTSLDKPKKETLPEDHVVEQENENSEPDVTVEQQGLAAAQVQVQAQVQMQTATQGDQTVSLGAKGLNQIAESGQVQLMVGQNVQKSGEALLKGTAQTTETGTEKQIQLPFQSSIDTVKAALLKEATQQQNQQQATIQTQPNSMMQETVETNAQPKTSEMDQLITESKSDATETNPQEVTLMAKTEPLDLSKVNIKVADAPVDATQPNFADQLADKIIYKMDEGKQEFDLQLNPKDLGKLNIKLIFENGNAQVLITCANSKSQHMLASLTDNIRGILEANTGVTSTVQLQKEDLLEGQYNQDSFNQESEARQNRQQQQNKNQTAEDLSFIDKLRLGLIDNLEVAV